MLLIEANDKKAYSDSEGPPKEKKKKKKTGGIRTRLLQSLVSERGGSLINRGEGQRGRLI